MKKQVLIGIFTLFGLFNTHAQIGETFETITKKMGDNYIMGNHSSKEVWIVYNEYIPSNRYEFIKTNKGLICNSYGLIDDIKKMHKYVKFLNRNATKTNTLEWINYSHKIKIKLAILSDNEFIYVRVRPIEQAIEITQGTAGFSDIIINGGDTNEEHPTMFILGIIDDDGVTKITPTR